MSIVPGALLHLSRPVPLQQRLGNITDLAPAARSVVSATGITASLSVSPTPSSAASTPPPASIAASADELERHQQSATVALRSITAATSHRDHNRPGGSGRHGQRRQSRTPPHSRLRCVISAMPAAADLDCGTAARLVNRTAAGGVVLPWFPPTARPVSSCSQAAPTAGARVAAARSSHGPQQSSLAARCDDHTTASVAAPPSLTSCCPPCLLSGATTATLLAILDLWCSACPSSSRCTTCASASTAASRPSATALTTTSFADTRRTSRTVRRRPAAQQQGRDLCQCNQH